MAIFGISAHRTTTYHTQGLGLLNSGWLPDPVATAGMKAAVTGQSVSDAIMNSFTSGSGVMLKQYYLYAKRRFKKRHNHWELSIKNSIPEQLLGLNKDRLETLFPYLKNSAYRIVQDMDLFSIAGAKYYQDMNDIFGINDFTTVKPDGSNVVLTGIAQANEVLDADGYLGNSWVIGTETTKGIPAVILDPTIDASLIKGEYYLVSRQKYIPELSGGIVYWKSDLGEQRTPNRFNEETKTILEPEQVKLGLVKDINEIKLIARTTNWKDDSKHFSIDIDKEDLDDSTTTEDVELTQPRESIVYYYAQYSGSGNDFNFWEEHSIIDYDTVHFVWATETAESHTGVRKYFTEPEKLTGNVLESSRDRATKHRFKFYCYLPIKEYGQNTLDYSRVGKYINALKNVSKPTSNTETDAPKANRDGRKEARNAERSKYTRIIANEARYTRRIKAYGQAGITKSDTRHLNHLGKLLSMDYAAISASLVSGKDSDKIYHASALPSVVLGSNHDDVNEYTYRFFKRLYQNYGESSFERFSLAVDKLPDNCTFKDVLNLPRVELNYGIEGGQFSGGISFTFIKRFKLKGSIRKTKRKRLLKEVRRGKLKYLRTLSGSDLKQALIEPEKILVEDKYYTSEASGKQYNIGGGDINLEAGTPNNTISLNPFRSFFDKNKKGSFLLGATVEMQPERDKAEMMFTKYGYTFFCKQTRENELDVIAVAGLIGFQRSGYVAHNHSSVLLDGNTVIARADFDLGLFYERNKKRFIDKVYKDDINVQTVFTAGSKRYKLETNIQYFFIIPLDYNTLYRMSGASVLRLSQRSVMMLTWTKVRFRRLRGWVSDAIKAIGYIIAVITIIYSYGGAIKEAASVAAIATIIAKAIATTVAINLIAKYGVRLLIRVLGIRGIFALILIVVAAAIAAAVTGYFNVNSSLPYASQLVTSQTASAIGTQAVNQAAQQTLAQSVQQAISSYTAEIVKNISEMTLKQFSEFALSSATKLATITSQEIGKDIARINKQVEAASEDFKKHMQKLEDIKEADKELSAPYDIKEVLGHLRIPRLQDPDLFIQQALTSTNDLASYEYLSQFLEHKLNIHPAYFDAVNSLDFSLKYERT